MHDLLIHMQYFDGCLQVLNERRIACCRAQGARTAEIGVPEGRAGMQQGPLGRKGSAEAEVSTEDGQ